MAEANISTSQQAFDTQELDSLNVQQQLAEHGDASVPTGAASQNRADTPVATPAAGVQDGPSLFAKDPVPAHNQENLNSSARVAESNDTQTTGNNIDRSGRSADLGGVNTLAGVATPVGNNTVLSTWLVAGGAGPDVAVQQATVAEAGGMRTGVAQAQVARAGVTAGSGAASVTNATAATVTAPSVTPVTPTVTAPTVASPAEAVAAAAVVPVVAPISSPTVTNAVITPTQVFQPNTAALLVTPITPTNTAPVVTAPLVVSTIEDSATLRVDALLNASDPDAGTVLSVVNLPSSLPNGVTFNASTHSFVIDPGHAAFQSLAAGQQQVIQIDYGVSDGTLVTPTSVKLTVTGTNDAAVITGTSTVGLVEANNVAALSTKGALSATDVDGSASFVAQSNVAGNNGHGQFSIGTDGAWTYTANSAHNEFVGGQTYTDSFTVATADGTSQVITVSMMGSNDAAVITGTSTASLTETNAAASLSTTGTLSVTDVDSSAAFVAQTGVAGNNGYGQFSIGTDGAWTYTANSAHNEFVGGQTYTDSFTVATADGTSQVITVSMTGSNDAAVITGTSTASLTETNSAASLSTTGTLSATDVDSSAAFVAQSNVAGNNGYGQFSIGTNGVWTYTANSAHNEFVGGQTYTDSFTVATADGTSQVITVSMTGSNETVVFSGTSSASLTESNNAASLSTSGTVTASDLNGNVPIVAQSNVAGNNGYGQFSISTDGTWTYTANSAHNEFVGGQTYTDSFTVTTADGTSQVITVSMTGSNDAAVITGTSTASLTETNVATSLSTTGTLSATDVDSSAAFVAQSNVAGNNGYGQFSIGADGAWTYTANSAHNEFVGGQTYTDSFTVATADGTTQIITVSMTGSNETVVFSGTSSASLTESNNAASLSTSGTVTASDLNGNVPIVAQSNVAGNNGYGQFSIGTDGAWTYTANSAHNEFVGGQTYTDSFTVATADGTSQVITVSMTGSNDAAVITGTSTASLTETNAAASLSTTGSLSATDVDSSAAFVAQSNVAGNNGYGQFSIGTDGVWTYTANSAHNEFVGGQTYTDSFTVATTDGTSQVITVSMTGSNDAAVITGTSTASLTETNSAASLSTTGSLSATDVDSSAAFVAQSNVVGNNGYGQFSIGTDGAWTYTANSAHNEFVGGQTYTDSFTVATADGTSQVITVSMTGSNDAAVITGTSTASLTETNAAASLSTTGSLSATDVDSSAAFVAQSNVAGNNGYGQFSIGTDGQWTYTANSAHNEFVGGQTYTDSFTVATADGTSQVITVSMTGSNDAAVITGTSTASLTETNAAASLSTTGSLSANDVDSSAAFVSQNGVAGSNGYGQFSIGADGAWTYTANSAHNEFVGGQTYADSFTVATADGTSQVITVSMTGSNDAAVITGTSTASLTETNAAASLSTTGTLSATDVDSSAAFVAQTGVAGNNGYGQFSIGTDGQWTYTANSAHNEFVGGQTYTDSFTVATADGTSQVITVSMTGSNDAAVITGTSTASLTETNAAASLSTTGSLSATDVDSSAAFVAQTGVTGNNGYGQFSIGTDGAWIYTANSAHNEFVGGQTYTDSFTVATADGTSQVITVSMTGSNDAAVITGTSAASLTETNAAASLSTTGSLSATDVDSSAAFVAQSNVAGNNGYGQFSIGTNGAWTYTANNAHNEFVAGQTYTDSFTVATADGTNQVITVSMTGSNDAAVITGTSTASLTETNSAASLSTTGTLSATDVDSSAAFVAQTGVAGNNGYGQFSIGTDGAWTYTANNAHNEFVAGQTYTDSFTVATADGTSQVITVSMTGSNDAAVITGTNTASLTETNAAASLSTTGSLSATDVDSSAAFVAQTGVAGNNGYGQFSIGTDGAWTYTANSAHNEFVGGQTYTDSFTVATADGTNQVITVSMTGSNDAAVITGTSTASLTETNAAASLSTTGTLSATDVDGSAAFVAQTGVAGNNGYGQFSIGTDGTWTYTASSAHNEFVGGQTYTDSFTVATADGTSQVITVSMTGSNDAAVITGTSTASLTETNAAASLSTTGSLSATDVDSSSAFVAQSNVAGNNGYGQFSIGADGAWTYTANSAHNEFVGGQTYTDSFTVATADGTSQVITVSMTGSNDAAVITGTSSASLTETNAAASLSTTGTLSATDVDSSAAFVAQTGVAGNNGYGQFSIGTDGAWTYTANSAHNEFVGGQTYTDSFTVATADGTSQVITVTMTGTNDAAVITGTSTASLTETNGAASLSTTGTLSATDVDSSALFVAQTAVAGNNGYGQFSIGTDGQWTYTANSAHNEFVGGQTYTDSFTVATADGTTQVITVSMTGSNDAAVITGTSTASLTETNAAASLSTTGSLSATDVDSSAAFVAQTGVAGNNGYGQFSIGTNGAWTYTANSAHNEFVGGQTYTDSFTVATADGTSQVITVSMTGSNDAAVITGTSTASLTETNSAASLSTTGTLSATDVDSSAAFVAQSNVAGNNGYGQFSIGTNGVWTYTANSAHNEFVGGQTYTDSFTVATADGTSQVITVTMTGSNDAAVITGTSTASLTETNAAASLSTTGSLSATDVDSNAVFVAQSNVAGNNGYGQFSIGTDGAWTYTANSAHNEFVGGQTYTDSFTVATADGTSQVITVSMTGSNDAAVITGTSTASLTETNATASLSTTGSLSATDVDSSAAFVAQTGVAGNNGYGQFSIGTNGAWTYTANSAHNEFVGGQTYTDSFTVATADGTSQVITVTMTGSNDAAVITGTSTASLTETNAAASLSTTGSLSATDVDSNAVFVAQSNVAGNNGYGQFSIGTDGVWTYTANSAHNEFVGGQTYTDSFTVATADGTTQVITVSMTGSNDAAVITGTSTASLTETNAAASLSTTGTLSVTDVDSSTLFVAQTAVAGSNGYGQFSIGTDGAWTYTANSAHNEFVGGQTYTDSFTVATADGTSQVITVSMTGSNDAAVITGTSTASLTETNSAASLSTTGTLSATDVDSSAAFVAQTGVAGNNGYGQFSIGTDGAWTYTANSAHNEFADGQTYTDSFTVATADGTSQVITVSMTGSNDAAVITGTSTASLTETNSAASLSTTGSLSATDVDSSAAFVAQSNVAGSNGYGQFSIGTNGAWTYTANNAHNEFVGGQTYTDSFTVATADGTTQVITVSMTGTNDAAVITGTSTASLTETNSAASLSTIGTLSATDVDSSAAFVAQTGVAGSNGYGQFSIGTNGAWTYTANSAHNEFVGGQTYTDSFTVATADGTNQVITVSMTGSNDAAVITGTSTASLTETNAAVSLSTTGTLSATDVDSSALFVAQTAVAGSNGYGQFSIGTNGSWTYTANNAHNEFVGGQTYTDSFTVATADGTTQVITVSMTGSNDAAVITGTSTASLTETNAAASLSTTGTLSATDVDSSALFVAQTAVAGSNGYGQFSIGTNGAWTYTANSAHNEFVGGQTYTDSFTVATADGTNQVITVSMTGSNDAAVITGTSTASLTETNAAASLSTTGSLSATDVDSNASFVAQTGVAGNNGYGQFSIGTNGAWTYTANNAHNEFVGGQTYTDSFTVATADGTSQVISVTMTGTNDAAVITGTSTASLTETNAAASLSTTGSLSATDVDSSAAFVAQTAVAGSNGYGQFSIGTNGSWTYTANNAHNEFVGGQTYTDSFTVATADGTSQVITVTMTGTNDAAVITGTSTASLTETNSAASLSTIGTLSATDVDSSAAFVAQTGVAGSNGYGQFSIGTNGAWTYTANNAHNEFVGGQTYTDSFTVATADGTSQVITVTMTGTNDAAVITGTSTASLTETNAAASLSTTGSLSATDVDSSAAFVAQSNVAGNNGYGQFSIGTNGAWTYTANSAHNEFVGGQTYTDSFTVATADGTSQVITVTMTGTNDAAVISGTTTGALTETNAAQSTGGTLTSTDVDGTANLFTAQSNVAGGNGYGQFSIASNGVWTYTMNTAHDEFVSGQTYTDTVTVAAADGTSQVLTVTMTGTNDAPVLTANATHLAYTENAAVAAINPGITATDVDNTVLTGATVSITAGLTTGDMLSFTNQNGIVGSYNQTTGVLTLSGSATVAQYQTALSSVSYASLNDNPTSVSATRTIGWVVNDGSANSSTATSTIDVTAVNDAPVVNTQNLILAPGKILFMAADIDNATLSLNTPFASAFGSPSVGTGGYFELTPTQQTSAVTGTLQVSDGTANTNVLAMSLGTSGTDSFDQSASSSANALFGFAGTDTLKGGSGADMLVGGAGADTLTGGSGADTFAYASGDTALTIGGTNMNGTISGYDVITDFASGTDKLMLPGTPFIPANATVNGTNSTLKVNTNTTVSSHKITDGIIQFDDANTFAAPVSLTTIGDVAAVVQYLRANDLGNAGATVAFTATISSVTHTYIYSQVGATPSATNDLLIDLSGVSNITGLSALISNGTLAASTDYLVATSGNDTLTGDSGLSDTVSYSAATSGVTMNLSVATAQTTGGSGSDTVTGMENVVGSAFADTLTGNASNNLLIGGAGNDTLSGGGGNDILIGGQGVDTLTGGTGADTFKYNTLTDLPTLSSGSKELITDFNSAIDGDKLDFGTLLNNLPSSAGTLLQNTMTIDSTDGATTHSILNIFDGNNTYVLDIQNANPNSGVNGATYVELDSQKLLQGTSNTTTASNWSDIVDIKGTYHGVSAAGTTPVDGWVIKAASTPTWASGLSVDSASGSADTSGNTTVQIVTSDGVTHNIDNVDKIIWHA